MAKKTEVEKPKTDPETTQTTPPIQQNEEVAQLKSTIEEMKKQFEGYGQYIQASETVFNTIASDPELLRAFQSRLGGQNPAPQAPNPPQQPQNQSDPRIDDLSASQREEIILQFERDMGISNLPAEEQAATRQRISGVMKKFGQSIDKVPLQSLRDTIDTAYVASHAEKLKEEGKLEGITQMRNNQSATMGTFSGGAPETNPQEPDLTPGQKSWAEKLGVDPEKAKKVYLERDKEEKRVPPAEQKK